MYKEYNIWSDDLGIDEWVPDAYTAEIVHRIIVSLANPGDIRISRYTWRDPDGRRDFESLAPEQLAALSDKQKAEAASGD